MSEVLDTQGDDAIAEAQLLKKLIREVLAEMVQKNADPLSVDIPRLDKQAFKVLQFCQAHSMSLSTFYKLQKQGRAPPVIWYGAQPRITVEAAREWRTTRMVAEANSKKTRLERERRVVLAKRAGKAAAQSEDHVSNRPKGWRKTGWRKKNKPKDKPKKEQQVKQQ